VARGVKKPAPRPSATYLYAVLERDTPPALAAAPDGLPGLGPVRALAAGPRLWLLAATAPLDLYGPGPVEKGLKDLDWVGARALAHEALIEHFGAQGTIVPMKLFTLFTSDARAQSHVTGMRRRLAGVLRRLAGRQEWGVRVSLDARAAQDAVRESARSAARGLAGGTGFLMAKKVAQSESRRLLTEARAAAEGLFERLSGRAAAALRRPPASSEGQEPLLLDAAFLVPSARGDAFQRRVAGEAQKLRARGCRVVLTGPWPAYNFIEGQASR
jgi:hypothetical protein